MLSFIMGQVINLVSGCPIFGIRLLDQNNLSGAEIQEAKLFSDLGGG
jgi:hypothetical protein